MLIILLKSDELIHADTTIELKPSYGAQTQLLGNNDAGYDLHQPCSIQFTIAL
jgi:hypothetical protein